MDLREARASLDEYSDALATSERMLNFSEGMLGEAILAVGRPLIAKLEVLARESAELAVLIKKGITEPHFFESRPNEVLEVCAALQRLKLAADKATEAKERFKNRDSMGEFTIDIEQAKAFRDLERRFILFEQKRFAPTEMGRLSAAEIVEAAELKAAIAKAAEAFAGSPGCVSNDVTRDSNRLHQLDCKRMSPGGVLSNVEDDEDARLRVRIAALWHSPKGRDAQRMNELSFKRLRRCCSVDEEKELEALEMLYPRRENPGPESPQLKAIREMRAERKERRASKRGAV